jgi:rhodanese-related sulfurtransferase
VTMKRYLIVVGILLLALVGVFTIVSCNNDTDGTTGYTDLTPAEAQNLIADNPDLIIIDVSPAYDQGHLPGAVSYPVGDGTLEAVIPTLDKDATYLVYCHVDSVAIQGALALVDAGFTNVYRLEGNYSGWVDAGYPIEQ